ncbi:MAG: hypothetical protein H8E57_09620 [Candidatus Cloacimonetes bacterium]|nr:hypothetical protein [Candidatus Cloacimonadota bacterium]
MNIEFHYYITKYLALEAGFDQDEAEVIAYSSQYIDDNVKNYKIASPEGFYENFITQTPNISKPVHSRFRNYILLHYMPGIPTSFKAARKDGKMHLLMTTPASNYAQEIFFESTKNEDLYYLGIASHMLADTYSYQNFIGNMDEMNSLSDAWEKTSAAIGHADVPLKPDIPNLIWIDPRLIPENSTVNNKERVIFAAKKLYSNYLFITSGENNWSQVKKNLTNILSKTITETQLSLAESQKEERISKYKELLSTFDIEYDYDPQRWLNASLSKDISEDDTNLSFAENYLESNWYKFQEAIKSYLQMSEAKLKPLLEQIEFKNW